MGGLAGCAAAPEIEPVINTNIYNKSRSDVWQELQSYFKSSSIPVTSRDKVAGILLAERHLERASIYGVCPNNGITSASNSILRVKVTLQSLGRYKTRARVDVTFETFRSFVGLGKKEIKCFSNGTLEKSILANL